MHRRGETCVAGGCDVTPFMVSTSCFVEFKTSCTHIVLTKREFDYFRSGLTSVELQFRTLEL